MKTTNIYALVALVARQSHEVFTGQSHASGPSLEGAAMRLRHATATAFGVREDG